MTERDEPRPARTGPAWPRPGPILLLILLLLLNWVVAALVTGPGTRAAVSYTFFVTQVQRSNVAEITSVGDTINGTFRAEVDYTPYGGTQGEQVGRFTTERPSFADDNLFPLLQANGVEVNADRPAPLGQRLLIGFGPALLLFLLVAWWMTRPRVGKRPGEVS